MHFNQVSTLEVEYPNFYKEQLNKMSLGKGLRNRKFDSMQIWWCKYGVALFS